MDAIRLSDFSSTWSPGRCRDGSMFNVGCGSRGRCGNWPGMDCGGGSRCCRVTVIICPETAPLCSAEVESKQTSQCNRCKNSRMAVCREEDGFHDDLTISASGW